MRLVLVWLVNTLALLALPYVIPGREGRHLHAPR